MANARRKTRQEGKTARVPLGGHRAKLQLSDEDMKEFKRRKRVPRWVNDQDDRVARALAGGYTFVKPENAGSLGQGAIHQGNADEGSKVSKVVSRGEPVIRAYLMEISEKFYKEDQEAKEEVNRRVDESLKRGNAGGAHVENQYGDGVYYSH